MKKFYKFSELSLQAKRIAVKDYIAGWEETHPKGDMSYLDAKSACIDTEDEIVYDIYGNPLGHPDDQ